MREATTMRRVDYFHLPRLLWRKLKKCLPKHRKEGTRGGRPRASDRAVINAIWYVLWTVCQWKALHREWFGVSSSVVHERFQRWRPMRLFEKLMKRMVEYYARERGGIGWKWQAMDSKHSAAPLGGGKTVKNPTDRGKLGAKMNLLVDERGAPISVVITGANRHDKISAVDLIVSMRLKGPAHKEQHLCADNAYESEDLREFATSAGYIAHIKINPRRRKGAACCRRNKGALVYRGVPREGLSGQEVERGAHDFMVEQASQPPYSLVQESRKLAGTRSACLRLHLAQSGGFRIES